MKPYYEHAGITIYHGDCREFIEFLGFDVLVTDPPYGVNIGSSNDVRGNHHLVKGSYASYEDTEENLVKTVVPPIRIALAAARRQRGLVFCAGHNAWLFPRADAIGGVFLPSASGRHVWGFSSFAHCLLYGKAPNAHKGMKPTGLRSVDHCESNGHPCPKPLSWMKWALDLAADPVDVVLDPFMGSGTTLRAAKDMGRRAIGIEIEERYCEIAAKRLAQETFDFDPKSAQLAVENAVKK